MVSLLGEKFLFLTPLGQPKFHEFLNFLPIFHIVLSKTFHNNLNYACTSNIRELIKFYNIGDESSETDLRFFVTLCFLVDNMSGVGI